MSKIHGHLKLEERNPVSSTMQSCISVLLVSQKKHLKCHGVKENVREGKAYIPVYLNPVFFVMVYQL